MYGGIILVKHVTELNKHIKETEYTLTADYNRLLTDKIMAIADSVAKTEYLARISHEMRTPLNSIIAMSEMLATANLTKDQKKFLEISNRASLSLLDMINNLIFIKSLDLNQVELHNSECNLIELIYSSVSFITEKYKENKVDLKIYIDKNLPKKIICDEKKLVQVLSNILSNAFKFTDNGKVELNVYPKKVRKRSVDIVFSIQDTGVGIAPKDLNQIFEKFRLVDYSLTRGQSGTGLGLTISNELVKIMGGKLNAKSATGEGSIFEVQLKFNLKEQNINNFVLKNKENLLNLNILFLKDNKKETNKIIRHLREQKALLTIVKENDKFTKNFLNNKFKSFDLIIGNEEAFTKNITEKNIEDNNAKIIMSTSLSANKNILLNQEKSKSQVLVAPYKFEDLLFLINKSLGRTKCVEVTDIKMNEKVQEIHRNQFSLLLVEDSKDNQNIVKAYLKNSDVKITTVENGQEAIDCYKKNQYDIILMDIQMPLMDGYTATKEIRRMERVQSSKHTPIIAVTAHALGSEMKKCIESGCNEVISKPFSKKQLLDKINEFLIQNEQAEELLEEIKQLRPVFINNKLLKLNEIKIAYKKGDLLTIKGYGHTLKGDSRPYGFKVLEDLGKNLELEAGRKIPDKELVYVCILKIEQYLENEKLKLSKK